MKAVALILALAVVSGCQARAVLPEPTPTRVEAAVDRFWQYIAELNTQADGVVQNIKGSQLTRELDTLITDTMSELTTYRDGITAKLGPYSTGQLTQDVQLLSNRLHRDMLDAQQRSSQYLEEVKSLVDQNMEDVQARLSTYTRKLKKRLNKDTEEIRTTVTTYLSEVHSRTSQNMDLVREHVQPYVNQAHGSATAKLGTFGTLLKTQAEDLTQQLETRAEGLKGQLETTAEELRAAMEEKMDKFGDIIAPLADQFRAQIQAIMDKVKETSGK